MFTVLKCRTMILFIFHQLFGHFFHRSIYVQKLRRIYAQIVFEFKKSPDFAIFFKFRNTYVKKFTLFCIVFLKKVPTQYLPKKLLQGFRDNLLWQRALLHITSFFVPVSFVKECTDLLMSKSKSLLIVFVAYHHNANVNPRGYNEFISRFCVLCTFVVWKPAHAEHRGLKSGKKCNLGKPQCFP